jgi:hypothetical protein
MPRASEVHRPTERARVIAALTAPLGLTESPFEPGAFARWVRDIRGEYSGEPRSYRRERGFGAGGGWLWKLPRPREASAALSREASDASSIRAIAAARIPLAHSLDERPVRSRWLT